MEKAQFVKPHKKKNHLVTFLVIAFLGIFFFLIYTSFYNPELGNTITGNSIKNLEIDLSNAVHIDANLGVPEQMQITSPTEKLSLKLESSEIHIGKQLINLDSKTSIILDNYAGKITFTSNKISELDGKATKAFIDGIPISPSSGNDLDIFLEKESEYSFIEIENFNLASIAYTTDGVININNGNIIIRVDNKPIEIKNFIGNLKISRNSLQLNGYADKSNINNLVSSISSEA